MPKKTRYKQKRKTEEPDFYETLGATLPYRQLELANPALEGTPLWVYPAWIAGSIILGVLLGLAIKDFQAVKDTIVSPGIVAKINDPQYTVASSGLQVSQTASRVIQGDSTDLQGSTQPLQSGEATNWYQNGFSAYGQQGSVNAPAAQQ